MVLLCCPTKRYISSQPEVSEPSLTKKMQGEARSKESEEDASSSS
jgi:hypothetical protein